MSRRAPGGLAEMSLVALARHLSLDYVATNNVHYARRDGQRLQDVLIAIRQRRER